MKKFRLLLAAVLITATLSAFTNKMPTTDAYRLENGTFIFSPVEGASCFEHDTYACEYTWTGAVSNDPQDEDNYVPVSGKEDKYYFVP